MRGKIKAFAVFALAFAIAMSFGACNSSCSGNKDAGSVIPDSSQEQVNSDDEKPTEETCQHSDKVLIEEKEPTCTEDGYKKYKCTECEAIITETTDELGHEYSKAQETGKCTRCDSVISTLGLTYTLSEDETYYSVSGENLSEEVKEDGNIVVPEYYNNLPVAEIKAKTDEEANGFAGSSWLKSVTIPKTITKIGDGAFSETNLETLYFDAENCADFNGRNWIFLPGSTSDGMYVIIGKHVKHIPGRLFFPLITSPNKIPLLKSLTFAEGSTLESIGDYAFYGSALEEVHFPDSVRTVGEQAFYDNATLSSVTLSGNLEELGEEAFYCCSSLTEIDLSGTALTSLEKSVFGNCSSLSAATLPTGLLLIGEKAFYGCMSLEEINIPSGVTSIEKNAFYGCTKLTSVNLPSALVSLGNSAFENCAALDDITYSARSLTELPAGNRVFYNAGVNGVDINVESGVEILPSRLFYSSANSSANIKIASLTIAADVRKIGAYAFLGVEITAANYLGESIDNVDIGAGNEALTNALTEV